MFFDIYDEIFLWCTSTKGESTNQINICDRWNEHVVIDSYREERPYPCFCSLVKTFCFIPGACNATELALTNARLSVPAVEPCQKENITCTFGYELKNDTYSNVFCHLNAVWAARVPQCTRKKMLLSKSKSGKYWKMMDYSTNPNNVTQGINK